MEKDELREQVWDGLEDTGEARFPFPPHGRIPNFAGAGAAADRLADLPVFQTADAIKINPDSPQRPVRKHALRAGKTLYMAVPRLAEEACFLELHPERIEDIDHATTIGGADELGVPVTPDEMPPIDLVVSGSVAVTDAGERVGKGEGYSDLEYALLRELGHVDGETPVATTVHEQQVVAAAVDTGDHDVFLDVVITPERTVRVADAPKPTGIDWDLLSAERIDEMPVLDRFDG